MPRLISAPFFDATPVFSRAEYASAFSPVSDKFLRPQKILKKIDKHIIQRYCCVMIPNATTSTGYLLPGVQRRVMERG